LDFSHAEILAEPLQPFLGKNAPCAVIQAEVSAFIPYGLLDLPKGDAPGSEADIQFGVEPVVAAEEPDRDLCFMRIQPIVPELVESKNTDAALLPVVERVEEPVVVQEMLPVQVKIGQLLFDLLVEIGMLAHNERGKRNFRIHIPFYTEAGFHTLMINLFFTQDSNLRIPVFHHRAKSHVIPGIAQVEKPLRFLIKTVFPKLFGRGGGEIGRASCRERE